MFTTESLQQNVTIVLGGTESNEDGRLIFGTFTNGAFDFSKTLETNGPVKKLVRTKDDTFYVFEDAPVPIQTFTLTDPLLVNYPTPLKTQAMDAVAYLPTSDTFVATATPTELLYVHPNGVTNTAYNAAKVAEGDEALVYVGAKANITSEGDGSGGGNLVTDGSLNIGSKSTHDYNLDDDYTYYFDVCTRNGGGLLYSGPDEYVMYQNHSGVGLNRILTGKPISNIFRYDSPSGNALSERTDFTMYLFVRQSDKEAGDTPVLSYAYEYRSLADFTAAPSGTQWKLGPILPENPQIVSITSGTYTSGTPLAANQIVSTSAAPNTYFFTVTGGTSGAVTAAPLYSRTPTAYGPDAVGVSAAVQDSSTNFTAFATKSPSDIPDNETTKSVAITFSDDTLDNLPYVGTSTSLAPVVLTEAQTKVSVFSWNNGNSTTASQFTPVEIAVPAGAQVARIFMWGAGGNNDGPNTSSTGGPGGYVYGEVQVTDVETIKVIVGMAGNQLDDVNTDFTGGFAVTGMGGGRSAIRFDGASVDILTAGGGGGATGTGMGGPGGSPGGNGVTDANSYDPVDCGGGATQTQGGASNDPNGAGTEYTGGTSNAFAGGGSGYFGGGAANGTNAGAGGGSSYADAGLVTNVVFQSGSKSLPYSPETPIFPEYTPGKGGDSDVPREGFVYIEFLVRSKPASATASTDRTLYMSTSSTWMNSMSSFSSAFLTAQYKGSTAMPSLVTNLGVSYGLVLASLDTIGQIYEPATLYPPKSIVRYQGTEYTATTQTTAVPGQSTDWVTTNSTTLVYTQTASDETFFTSPPILQDVLDSTGAPIHFSGLNAIRSFPNASKIPTFVLLGAGYAILKYRNGSFHLTHGSLLPGLSTSDASAFNCIDGGYEAGRNAFMIAAVPKYANVKFYAQTTYAPTFALSPVTNPLRNPPIQNPGNGPTTFPTTTLFATNGVITVAAGGPLENGREFTGSNITWAPNSPIGAYVSSFGRLYNGEADFRYEPYLQLPVQSSWTQTYMSPANLLVTKDGSSYAMVQDDTSRPKLSAYMLTFFNTFFPSATKVTTAQFNDVAYIPLSETTGYFMAVGTAIWDFNSLADSTWTGSVPPNVLWVSRILQSLTDFESAQFWRPIRISTSVGHDPMDCQSVTYSEGQVLLCTTFGTYRMQPNSLTNSSQSVQMTQTANAGLYPSACAPTNSYTCDVCNEGSYLENVFVVDAPGDESKTIQVCINAVNLAAANEDAQTINGDSNTVVPGLGSTYVPTTDAIFVELWGAGGGNSMSMQTGGGGGYIAGTLQNVKGKTLVLITGTVGGATAATGFGQQGSISNGGGYTGIFVQTSSGPVPLLIAPGGGGGGVGNPAATGGGGSLASNFDLSVNGSSEITDAVASTDVGANGYPSASPTSTQSIVGAGAGGGYPIGNPGVLVGSGVTAGASGGAFYPPYNISVQFDNTFIDVSVETAEPGNTLQTAYMSQKATPGGIGSPHYTQPIGMSGSGGGLAIREVTGVRSFRVTNGTVTQLGTSKWEYTIQSLVPMINLESLACPMDPGFQSKTALTVTGTEYLTEFQTYIAKTYGSSPLTISASNLLPSSYANQNLSYTSATSSTSKAGTFGDLVQLPVVTQTVDTTYGQYLAGPEPDPPSDSQTIPSITKSDTQLCVASTVSWATGGSPTTKNYSKDFQNNPVPYDTVRVDQLMANWLDFGSLYALSGTVYLFHGPGTCTVDDVAAATTSPFLSAQADSTMIRAGYLPTTFQKGVVPTTTSWFTKWNLGSEQLAPSLTGLAPDPVLVTSFQTTHATATFSPPESSLAYMLSKNLFRPRNWAYTATSWGTLPSTTLPLLQLQNTTATEFLNPDPELTAPNDAFANTIVGLGRYQRYTYPTANAVESWPVWTVQGNVMAMRSDVLYSSRPYSMTVPSLFVYTQQKGTFAGATDPLTTLGCDVVFHVFLKVDQTEFDFCKPATTGSCAALGGAVIDYLTDPKKVRVRDSSGNLFSPLKHVYFIDPNQGYTNSGLSIGVSDTTPTSSVWSLETLAGVFAANGGFITELSEMTLSGTRLLFAQKHIVGITTTPVYDNLANTVTAPGSYAVTATEAYVCFSYAMKFPPLTAGTQLSNGVSTLIVNSKLWDPNILQMNYDGISINVEGERQDSTVIAQVPSTMIGSAGPAGSAMQIANVDIHVNAQTLTFTRYMKDLTRMYTQNGSYFQVPVSFRNPHYVPAYTLATTVASYSPMPVSAVVPTIVDPTLAYIPENLPLNMDYLTKNSSPAVPSPFQPMIVGVNKTQYQGTTGLSYNQPTIAANGARVGGTYTLLTAYSCIPGTVEPLSTATKFVKETLTITALAPMIMAKATDSVYVPNWPALDASVGFNQLHVSVDPTTSLVTLDNFGIVPSVASTYYTNSQNATITTFYISSPSAQDGYICFQNPSTTGTYKVILDPMFTVDDGVASYAHSDRYAEMRASVLAEFPLYNGNRTAGYGSLGQSFGDIQAGATPTEHMPATSTVTGTVYDMDYTTVPTAYIPRVLGLDGEVSFAAPADSLSWDAQNAYTLWRWGRTELNTNTIFYENGPAAFFCSGAFFAEAPVVFSNASDTEACAAQVVSTLNTFLIDSQLIQNFDDYNRNQQDKAIFNDITTNASYLIPSRQTSVDFWFDSLNDNGKYFLVFNYAVCNGDNSITGLFGDTYADVSLSIDCRFLDPLTRQILGLTRTSELFFTITMGYQPQDGFSNNLAGGRYMSTVFPDPMDFSTNTLVAHVVNLSSTGAYAQDPRSGLQMSFHTDPSNLPVGPAPISITINGATTFAPTGTGPSVVYAGPLNVDAIYDYSTIQDLFPVLQTPSLVPYMSSLAAANPTLGTSFLTAQGSVPNFNGFNSTNLGTFVQYAWNFWPWSNARMMTTGASVPFALTDGIAELPEFFSAPTDLYTISPLATGAIVPTSIVMLDSRLAIAGTTGGDVRRVDLDTGAVNVKSRDGAFLKNGVPLGTNSIQTTHILRSTTGQLHYFFWTTDGPFTSYYKSNSQTDLLEGNLQNLTFVPLFDTNGQCGLPVMGAQAYLAQLSTTGTMNFMRTMKNVLLIGATIASQSYLIFVWLEKTKLLYSSVSVQTTYGAGIAGDLLLAHTSTGLASSLASVNWKTPKVSGTLTYTPSTTFIADASVALPDFIVGGQNNIVSVMTELTTTLNNAIGDFPTRISQNPIHDGMIPLFSGSWETKVQVAAVFNGVPLPEYDAPLNVEGTTFYVTFTDLNPFVMNTSDPSFPVSGIQFDELTRYFFNFDKTVNPFAHLPSGDPMISAINSLEYADDNYPNFYRNVFFQLKPDGTSTLVKYRSKIRNVSQLFADQITGSAREVDANITISDIAYSPDKNILLWIPEGTFTASQCLYTTTIAPDVGLIGTPGGPTFNSAAKAIYNPYLTSFLVAGNAATFRVARLDVSDDPTWSNVLSGSESLGTKLKDFKLTCLGVSPSCECLAGSLNATTSLWFRLYQNTQWQRAIFDQPGTITALAFVGFGWYIATWDESVRTDTGYGVSSLWFASNNFTVVVYVDAWNDVDRTVKVNTIDFYNSQETSGACPTGYEQSTDNPNICYKVCPEAYEGIGSICAMKCPQGYATNVNPSFCVPDRYTPARIHQVIRNGRNILNPVDNTSTFDANVGPESNTGAAIKWAVGVSSAVALGGALAMSFMK